jgi:8-oxo-dGTP pyrophosphatase MutT (NUDIX family)
MHIPDIISRYDQWRTQYPYAAQNIVDNYTKAAVLVPLVPHPHGIHVLLNRRAEHLRDHPGQICFPGGRFDPKDNSPEDTALREAQEEIALPLEKVTIIGRLNQCRTITGFEITPILAHVEPPFSLTLDPIEVIESFEIPLSFILNKQHVQQQIITWHGQTHSYYVIEFAQYKIWGATASILVNLAEAISKDA